MHISSSSLIGEFPQFGAQSTSFFWHIQIANTCLKAYFSLCDREYSSLSSACKAFYYKPSTQFKNKQQSSQLTLQTKRKVGQLKSLNRQSQLCNKGFPIVFLGLFVVHWAVDMRSPPSERTFTAQWTMESPRKKIGLSTTKIEITARRTTTEPRQKIGKYGSKCWNVDLLILRIVGLSAKNHYLCIVF